MNAETFNSRYPVGTPVFAYAGARPQDDRDATRLVTKTRSRASVLGGHTDVVWVEGHSACIALSHVDVVTAAVYEAAKLADAVAEVERLRSERAEIGNEVARFGIYGAALPATRALVKRSDELVTENATLRAQVAELEAQRAALAARLRAGQRWERGRNPELVSENYVSQDELRSIFGIRLTAPWEAPVEDPCRPCGCPKRFVRHAHGCPTLRETGGAQ